MKLSDARGHYYTHTGLASTATRQLAFAGIAVIWIFKANGTQIPATLSLPLILMVATLALDLLQYTLNSAIWGITSWVKERELPDDQALAQDPDVVIWKHINFPGLVCFWAKLICVMTAYGYLFVRVFPLLFPTASVVQCGQYICGAGMNEHVVLFVLSQIVLGFQIMGSAILLYQIYQARNLGGDETRLLGNGSTDEVSQDWIGKIGLLVLREVKGQFRKQLLGFFFLFLGLFGQLILNFFLF